MSNYVIAALAVLCIAEGAYIALLLMVVHDREKAIAAATAQVTNMVKGIAN